MSALATERVHFRYRSYQLRARNARKAGCKRFCQVLHRRAGKDRSWLAITLEAMLERVGVYFHVFPSLNQGRRDLWDNVVHETIDGVERPIKMVDMFPPELIAPNGKNETEMQITLINGSVWQIMGADTQESVDRLRGPNPVGLVFSEYAFMLKSAWTTLEPVLAENGGWAAFIYTPKDETHGYELYNYAKTAHNWFCELLTIADTRRDGEGESGAQIITPAQLDEFRASGTTEMDIQREYYCSFKGFLHGTIYGDLITIARNERRIGQFPYIVNSPVGVSFDIGVSDHCAMWFYQLINNAKNFIDYSEDRQKTIQYYAAYLKQQKNYIYGRMSVPWDGRFAAMDYLSGVGFKNVDAARKTSIQEGIDVVRNEFSTYYFDESKCALGIKHLESYSREWDELARVFSQTPKHDEHSHGADALRTGAIAGWGPMEFFPGQGSSEIKVEMDFDPRGNFAPKDEVVYGRF